MFMFADHVFKIQLPNQLCHIDSCEQKSNQNYKNE